MKNLVKVGNKMEKEKTRGGARPGAGRKRLAEKRRVTLAAMVDPLTYAKIKRLAVEKNVSVGVLLDILAKDLLFF